MGFTCAYLKRVVPLAAVVGVVFSVQAQRAASHAGQPILFSSPESDAVLTNMPSLAPKPPESPGLGSSLEAPSSIDFSGPVVDTPLPVVAPVVSRTEALRLQDLLDRRKNWMLLTPAEILGTTTPEQILGIREHDEFGRPKNLTALERYTERQNQMPPVNANTNALPIWNISDAQSNPTNSLPDGLGNPDNLAGMPLNPMSDNQTLSGQDGNNGWTKLFGPPALAPAVTLAQQTDMDRFRQLLRPGSSSAAAATPSLSGTKISLPQTALSSGLGQSALTPVGASFTPLNGGIGKPAELPKLPSIWSLNSTSPPSAAAWAPQPPPWLSPTPQPFVAPQRRF
ncbi:MAG: hypothetical protein ABSF60_05335 [Verrucomicrobiota bacterium]|jgi:hypothetical protein